MKAQGAILCAITLQQALGIRLCALGSSAHCHRGPFKPAAANDQPRARRVRALGSSLPPPPLRKPRACLVRALGHLEPAAAIRKPRARILHALGSFLPPAAIQQAQGTQICVPWPSWTVAVGRKEPRARIMRALGFRMAAAGSK